MFIGNEKTIKGSYFSHKSSCSLHVKPQEYFFNFFITLLINGFYSNSTNIYVKILRTTGVSSTKWSSSKAWKWENDWRIVRFFKRIFDTVLLFRACAACCTDLLCNLLCSCCQWDDCFFHSLINISIWNQIFWRRNSSISLSTMCNWKICSRR